MKKKKEREEQKSNPIKVYNEINLYNYLELSLVQTQM
jgi:hypothetical protein